MKLRVLLTNFASMAVLRLGLAALTFALFWLLSHRLSTAELGGFSLLMNTFFMVQALPLLGMTMPLMRRVAASRADLAAEGSNAFYFALPVACLIGAGVALTGHWYAAEGLIWPFALLGLSLLPTAWIVVAEALLVGQERMQGIAYVNLLESLGRLVGSWLAIDAGLGLTGVFAVFAGLRCTAALAYLVHAHLLAPRWRLVQKSAMARYLREVPTYLSIAVVTALCTRIDIVLLSKLLSLRDAGVYAAAARLSDAALMLPTMAAVVIFPSQSRLFESDRATFVRLLERAVRWCSIAGFTVALCVVAFSPWLIRSVYVPSLAPAAPILQILILGATVMVIDQILSTTMMAARAQHADLTSMSIGLVSLVVLLVTLTHFFGLSGAAYAAPLSLLMRVAFRLRWGQRLFAPPLPYVALRIFVSAAVGIATFFSHPVGYAALDLAAALLAYAAALCITGSVATADLRSLRGLLSKSVGLRA